MACTYLAMLPPIMSTEVPSENREAKPRPETRGAYLAELEASLFSEGLHTLGAPPGRSELEGGAERAQPRVGAVAKQSLGGSRPCGSGSI